MIRPKDEMYQKTKLIKKGLSKIEPRYDKFIKWLKETYGEPLNISCDIIDIGNIKDKKGARIEIVMEFTDDIKKYCLKPHGRVDIIKDNKKLKILEKFAELVDEPVFREFYKNNKYSFLETSLLFASSFEEITKEEIIEGITKEDINKLLEEINNKELWNIKKMCSWTTFFVYTDEQLLKYKNDNKTIKNWNEKYIKLIKKYDEYNYFNGNYSIMLGSKEDLDINYNGNLYYYYK